MGYFNGRGGGLNRMRSGGWYGMGRQNVLRRVVSLFSLLIRFSYRLFITRVGRMESDVKVGLPAVLSSRLVSSSVYNMSMLVSALQGRWTTQRIS